MKIYERAKIALKEKDYPTLERICNWHRYKLGMTYNESCSWFVKYCGLDHEGYENLCRELDNLELKYWD